MGIRLEHSYLMKATVSNKYELDANASVRIKSQIIELAQMKSLTMKTRELINRSNHNLLKRILYNRGYLYKVD